MTGVRTILWAFCVCVLLDKTTPSSKKMCDQASSAILPEGNIGESEHFPWLGILRVHLHHGDSFRIALTGLVMVKERYAVANSDDISKIPKTVLKQDSKAMFIPKHGEPWYSPVKDYMMHPEFEFSTYNTIALVELALELGERAPFQPICWPEYFFNASNQLYALGFTDENKLLEKTVHKLQYVKVSLCNGFYHKAGLTDIKSAPTHVQCGFAKNNKKDCEWENGMALASNSSGKWTLLGIYLRWPGCAAPAHFVDLFPYLPWIESATDLVEDIMDQNQTAEVPLHHQFAYGYEVDVDGQRPYVVDRVDKDAIAIHMFDDMYEKTEGACSSFKHLIYKEKMRIVEQSVKNCRATYRISLYNMMISGYNCVKIKIKAYRQGKAQLWYRNSIDKDDWWPHVGGPETPHELLKYSPLYKRLPKNTGEPAEGEAWKPGSHLEPTFLKDTNEYSDIRNLNILVWFAFRHEATMELEVYGLGIPQNNPQTEEKNDTTEEKNDTRRVMTDTRRLNNIFDIIPRNKSKENSMTTVKMKYILDKHTERNEPDTLNENVNRITESNKEINMINITNDNLKQSNILENSYNNPSRSADEQNQYKQEGHMHRDIKKNSSGDSIESRKTKYNHSRSQYKDSFSKQNNSQRLHHSYRNDSSNRSQKKFGKLHHPHNSSDLSSYNEEYKNNKLYKHINDRKLRKLQKKYNRIKSKRPGNEQNDSKREHHKYRNYSNSSNVSQKKFRRLQFSHDKEEQDYYRNINDRPQNEILNRSMNAPKKSRKLLNNSSRRKLKDSKDLKNNSQRFNYSYRSKYLNKSSINKEKSRRLNYSQNSGNLSSSKEQTHYRKLNPINQSDKSRIPGDDQIKFRRLNTIHQTDLQYAANQYRLQKAMLRQAERLAKG